MGKNNKELREKIIIKNYTNSSLDLLLPHLCGIIKSCGGQYPCVFCIDVNEHKYAVLCDENKQSHRILIKDWDDEVKE